MGACVSASDKGEVYKCKIVKKNTSLEDVIDKNCSLEGKVKKTTLIRRNFLKNKEKN